jgi:hypothetical protein
MIEEGFMLLVMGFAGDAALAVKRKFIPAFQAMRAAPNAQREAFDARIREWELRVRESASRATVGSKDLLARRREKPALEDERRDLLDTVQLTLRLGLRDDPRTDPSCEGKKPAHHGRCVATGVNHAGRPGTR